MTKNKLILLSALFIAVALVGFIYAFTSPKGDRYYLPELYASWVCVHYNVAGAPPLAIEDGFLAHKVPLSGLIITSSEPRLSPKRDEYYYYSDKGIRAAKELQHGGGYSQQKKGEKEFRFYFWLSSSTIDSDYEKYVKNRDINVEPSCGPWKKHE